MAYKLAIFDFDGTLADSADWLKGVFNQVASRYGFKQISDEDFAVLRGRDNCAIIRHLGVPAWKMPFIANHMRKLAGRDASSIPLFDGSADLLRVLRERGVIVAIVSSNTEENIRRILGPHNACLVAHYECGASIFGKASKFRHVLRRTGVGPKDAIAIGDETRDIEAAMQANIAAGAVAWGYATPELLSSRSPAHMFETMDDIVATLAP